MRRSISFLLFISLTIISLLTGCTTTVNETPGKKVELLNVSYDPTRELYQDINQAFSAEWKKKTGENLTIKQSHGGSGKQARSVIDGLEADVVTLALGFDILAIQQKGLINENWEKKFDYNSSPFSSTIVLLVRKGNPKNIKDWSDLVKPGINVITPNPKTSGGARLNYLAAWGYALENNNNDEQKAYDFVKALYKNVTVLDSGARGSTTTFTERGIGDVLLSWENDALLAVNEIGKDKYEIVYPSYSILAEPPVALVDKNVDKHGTREVATAYLEFLYSPAGQEIGAKNYYRPHVKEIADQYTAQFPKLNLFTVQELFKSWENAQKIHFSDGGNFDKMTGSK